MKTVMLVDTSNSFLKLMEVLITRLGYKTRTAQSVKDCLRALEREIADMVICEVNLPDAKGTDLCRSITSSPALAGIVVVIISTDNREETRQLAKSNGCSAYLTKPVTVRPLFATLENLIGLQRRKHIRTSMEVQTTVRIDGKKQRLESYNFGEGGIFLKTENSPPVGTVLDISFQLPDMATPLHVKGEVIYTFGTKVQGYPPGFGVKFLHLSPEKQLVLTRSTEGYIARALPENPSEFEVPWKRSPGASASQPAGAVN